MNTFTRVSFGLGLLLLTGLWFNAPSFGQSILTISEIGDEQLEERSAGSIVDINATLQISINVDSVRLRAAAFTQFELPFDRTALQSVINILNRETAIFDNLTFATADTEEESIDKLNAFSSAMSDLLGFIRRSESATLRARANDIYTRFFAGTSDQESLYRNLFALVSEEIDRLRLEIDRVSGQQQVSFRLGAWIQDRQSSRPVHIPKFDTYDEGEFFEYPRWVVSISTADRQLFQNYADAADRFHKGGLASLARLQAEYIRIGEFLGIEEVDSCLRGLSQQIETFVTSKIDTTISGLQQTAGTLLNVKNSLDEILDGVRNIGDIAKGLPTDPALPPDAALLEWSNARLIDLSANIGTLITELYGLPDRIEAMVAPLGTLHNEAEILFAPVQDCARLVDERLGKVGSLIDAVKTWADAGINRQLETALAFGQEVTRFQIENIPESTELDLRLTGSRSPGDIIFLRATLGKPSRVNEGESVMELERRRMMMYQVEWHVDMKVGLIFANPKNIEGVILERAFQAAPSYSILLKRGSRKSVLYNRFWDFGIGLNVSAPDFNLDSTPEIGLGLVGSTARDYLQAGFGYDMGLDVWYWFFGIRLPMAALSLPGAQTSE